MELRLQPLRMSQASSSHSHVPPPLAAYEPPSKVQRLNEDHHSVRGKSKSKGASKSQGSDTQRTPSRCPELDRQSKKNEKGQPLCFKFQFNECPNTKTKPGVRCARGWHTCAFIRLSLVRCEADFLVVRSIPCVITTGWPQLGRCNRRACDVCLAPFILELFGSEVNVNVDITGQLRRRGWQSVSLGSVARRRRSSSSMSPLSAD
eukprot:2987787-Amphidinium_carterae.1